MSTAPKPPPRRLISHRTFAEWFGITPRLWRRRYNAGAVPAPHQQIGTDLLYDRDVIDHRLRTGLWPAGVEFVTKSRPSPGRGRPPAGNLRSGNDAHTS